MGCSPCFHPNLFFFTAGFHLHGFFHSSVQTDVLLWCGATVIHWSLHELFPISFAFCSLSSPNTSFIFPFMGMKQGRLSLLGSERKIPHHFFFHTTNNRNLKILPPSSFFNNQTRPYLKNKQLEKKKKNM